MEEQLGQERKGETSSHRTIKEKKRNGEGKERTHKQQNNDLQNATEKTRHMGPVKNTQGVGGLSVSSKEKKQEKEEE